MIVEDQSATEAFLGEQARSGSTRPGEVVATHISKVFLSDHSAFKLKRAVRFPYLDFSTATARLAACEQELALNRRTAPGLYLAVRRILRTAEGTLAFDAEGTLVDAVVEMRRFDQAELFDALALRGALTAPMIADLAHRIASFHAEAEVSTRHGGVAGMEAVLDINDRSLRATGLASLREADELAARFRAALSRHSPILEARRLAGKVRRCHGDLTLRNICLFDGVPTLFDCLEFDEDLATIDVLYDLAFLIMDLLHRGLAGEGNLLFNRYLDEADERGGLSLVAFFVAVRAAVRAHVTGARAAEAPLAEAAAATKEARAYLDLASSLLAAPQPRLIAIGGLSGAGKSTVAVAVAPMLGLPPGARILDRPDPQEPSWGPSRTAVAARSLSTRDIGEGLFNDARDGAGGAACGLRGGHGRGIRQALRARCDRGRRSRNRGPVRRRLARRPHRRYDETTESAHR